jgi:hypothetical protein
VAVLNSDDAFLVDKLEKQVEVIEDRPDLGAVFTQVHIVDDDGSAMTDEDHWAVGVFDQPNRSRTEWLRRFFDEGNCLCAPSVLMPRRRLLELGYLDKRFRQLPDLDLWVRMCLKHPIYIHPDRLTRFRVHGGSANTSAPTEETRIRDFWEHSLLLRNYLRISDEQELLRVFPDAAGYTDADLPLDGDGIAYVLARLALDHSGQRWEYFALSVLFDLFSEEARAERIAERFDFGYRELIELSGRLDVFRLF